METCRHEIIHKVIAIGDLVEDIIHKGLLLAEAHGGETEMGLVVGAWGGRRCLNHKRTPERPGP